MPPSVDAPPFPPSDFADTYSGDGGSDCSLDEIGAATVLGAMVEQRRRSSSLPAACELADSDTDAIATQRRPCLDPNDDLFQKIR